MSDADEYAEIVGWLIALAIGLFLIFACIFGPPPVTLPWLIKGAALVVFCKLVRS